MSDARLRELERLAAQGDTAAEARLLAERVRAGVLTPNAVKAAALLGHPAARTVEPEAPQPPTHRAPCARTGRRSTTLHGLRGPALQGHAATFARTPDYAFWYRTTFCGRDLGKGLMVCETEQAEPTCRTCLRSDLWREMQRTALGDLMYDLAVLCPPAGYRAGLAAVECVLPSWLQANPGDFETVDRILRLVQWALFMAPGKRPPPPREEPQPWDPAGLMDEGASAWVYGLACAALSLHDHTTDRATESAVAHDLRVLMRPVTEWTMGTGTGIELVEQVAGTIRERVLPYLLGGEDPLPVLEHHLRETVLPRARFPNLLGDD